MRRPHVAGAAVGLDPLLELLARSEGDHGARGDRDLLAGLGVAARALVLAAQVEVAEAGQLDLAPCSSASRSTSKKASTNSFASRLFRPTSSNRRSAISALVNAIAVPFSSG
jgi:hypothetical protein